MINTSCLNRIANLQWVQSSLDIIRRPQSKEIFNKAYHMCNEMTKKLDQYIEQSKKKIMKVVDALVPKCIKKQKRANQIFLFFQFFVMKIYQSYNENQNRQIFKNLTAFDAILCLACDLFNFAHNSPIQSYRQQSHYFEVPLIQALIPINWIGKNLQKPQQIYNYIYQLEKRILLQQIWQDEQAGCKLIKQQQQFMHSNQIGYKDLVIWNRLLKHILYRIQQLTQQVEYDQKYLRGTQVLMQKILKQKPDLLKKNKIDQIIVCCMAKILQINQMTSKEALQQVFNNFNRLRANSQENNHKLIHSLKLQDKNNVKQMNIEEFYRQVFVQQVQNLIKLQNAESDNSPYKSQSNQKSQQIQDQQNYDDQRNERNVEQDQQSDQSQQDPEKSQRQQKDVKQYSANNIQGVNTIISKQDPQKV